jgi:hypothetical protein
MVIKHWVNTYPHTIYVSVSLIDSKITGWKVGQYKMDCNSSHYGDGEIKYTEFIVNNEQEHDNVFSNLAHKWFKQWKIAKDYKGFKPY